MTKLEIIPLEGIPEIRPGDDLVEIVGQIDTIQSGDILVVTQKIISKAENQMIEIDPNDADAFYNRGISKKNIGDLNGACSDWRQTVFISPNANAAKFLRNECSYAY